MKYNKMLIVFVIMLSLVSSIVFPGRYQKLNWELLQKAWESYLDFPSNDKALRVLELIPNKPISHDSAGDKTISFIFDKCEPFLKYQILSSNRCAVKLAYRLLNISDGVYTGFLLWDLSMLVRINPILFLEELNDHRYTEAIKTLGLIVDRSHPNWFEGLGAAKLDRQLRIIALSSVKEQGLIRVRDECITILNATRYAVEKKSLNQEMNPRTDWEQIRNSWEVYREYPSNENVSKLLTALPNIHIDTLRSKTVQAVINDIFNCRIMLQYEIFSGNGSAVDLAYRLFNISDKINEEILLNFLSSLARINPKLFLTELKANRNSDAIKRFGLMIDYFASDYFNGENAKELERQLRIKSLESIKEPTLLSIRDECLKVLKKIDFS